MALGMLSYCAEQCQATTDFCVSDLGFAGSFYLETDADIQRNSHDIEYMLSSL